MDRQDKSVEYWRQKAEESDRVEWCETCGKSYFKHFETCPHLSHDE